MGQASRHTFNAAAAEFYRGTANVSATYCRQGIAVYEQLLDKWMEGLFQYRQKIAEFQANLEEATKYFGVLSTGRVLEMIDHEHRALGSVKVSPEIIDDILESFEKMDQRFLAFSTEAPLPLNRTGQAVLRDLTEASTGLLDKIRHLKTLSLCLIYEVDEFHNWQCDALIQDVDVSYGAYQTPWQNTTMKPVMERREDYMNEILVQYANVLMLHEDILTDLGHTRLHTGKMAVEAGKMSEHYGNKKGPVPAT